MHNQIRTNSQFREVRQDKDYRKKARQFIQNFSSQKSTAYHVYYATYYQSKEIGFIPNNIFFPCIEPTLNNFDFEAAYSDKTSYDLFIPKRFMPKTIFKIISGNFYTDNHRLLTKTDALNFLKKINKSLVLKPAIVSGGGRDIVFANANEIADLLFADKKYSVGSYILQEQIAQHREMAKFHPPSVNTCRLMTARVDSEIVVLSSFFRIGRDNKKMDNGQSGGIKCKINSDGTISGSAIDKFARTYYVHPDTDIKFDGFTIPNYSAVVDFCLQTHKKLMRFTFISWDIAIDQMGMPIFIEFNLRIQAITSHQILNGPLFGKYTDYFIGRYKEEKGKDILLI